MRDVVSSVLRIGGEMTIAATRGRAGRRQMLSWAKSLRDAAQELENSARGH